MKPEQLANKYFSIWHTKTQIATAQRYAQHSYRGFSVDIHPAHAHEISDLIHLSRTTQQEIYHGMDNLKKLVDMNPFLLRHSAGTFLMTHSSIDLDYGLPLGYIAINPTDMDEFPIIKNELKRDLNGSLDQLERDLCIDDVELAELKFCAIPACYEDGHVRAMVYPILQDLFNDNPELFLALKLSEKDKFAQAIAVQAGFKYLGHIEETIIPPGDIACSDQPRSTLIYLVNKEHFKESILADDAQDIMRISGFNTMGEIDA